MDGEFKLGQMEPDTKVNTPMIKHMAMGVSNTATEMCMMVSGSTKCAQALVLTMARMGPPTRDNGTKIINTEQLRRHILMGVNMKVNSTGDRSMASDSLHMQIRLSIRVNGYRIRLPESVFILLPMVASMKESSIMYNFRV